MILYLCKESGFVRNFCLFYLDIFSVRLKIFTVDGSSWSASKALDSSIQCLGLWLCGAACYGRFVFGVTNSYLLKFSAGS